MPETSSPLTGAPASPVPRVRVRNIQLARAIIAIVAALVITFSPDHSAGYGLFVFAGFAIVTAAVLAVAAALTYPGGRRWSWITNAAITLVAGLVAVVPALHTTPVFFAVVITWAAVTGIVEIVGAGRDRLRMREAGIVDPQRRSEARDGTTVGVLTVVLAMAIGLVSPDLSYDYFIDDAGQWFALTGIVVAVGLFGGYAAIVAVYLGIAAFTPQREVSIPEEESA